VRDEQRVAAAALAAAPAPAPHHGQPPVAVVAGASGVTLVKEEKEEEETLAQLRDRLDLAGSARVPAPGRRATFVHIKVEDSTSGEDTDGGEGDTGRWGEQGEGEGEGEGEGDGEKEAEEEGEGEGEGEGGEEEVEAKGEEEEEVAGDQIGGDKKKRADAPPHPLQYANVKWVEGQGERCTRSYRKPGGAGWRCSAAAVPGRSHCAKHAAQSKAGGEKARLKLAGPLIPASVGVHAGRAGGGGGDGGGGVSVGGGRTVASKLRAVTAKGGSGRWTASFVHNHKYMSLGTFDSEEDAARAWDRMMVWCHVHGVVLNQVGRMWDRVHTLDSIKAALNFVFEEYAAELNELQGVATQDAMVQKLRLEGRAQPGCKRKRV